MKRIIFLPFFVLLFSAYVYSQETYDQEKSVNILIRNDEGKVLENKIINLIFHFSDNSQNLQRCRGFQFTNYGNADLELLQGFSSFINTNSWKLIQEQGNNNRVGYYNTCSFAYFPKNSNSLLKGTKELLLLKYNDGTQSFLVIGYDGTNTLVITPR